MRSRKFVSPAYLFFAALLALSLIGPAWADEDDDRKQQEEATIDCSDRDNAHHSECQAVNPPADMTVQETSGGDAGQSGPPETPAPRQAGPVIYTGSPVDILLTLPDAGKEAVPTKFEEGTDNRGRWGRVRFERRTDSGSQDTFGPRVIDHTVYVTSTWEQAKQLFKDETAKNERFPEQSARDERKGFFKYDLINLVEQTSAISACNDCGGKDQLMLHHRIVQQRYNIVSVIYLYGREKRGSEEITSQKASELWPRKVSERI